ncbi:hypothetical protein GCM10009624_21190 [Gordonia sinesedis]
MGLTVLALIAALACGAAQAFAAPGTPTTPATPGTSTPKLPTDGLSSLPATGLPQVDDILNTLAGTGSSSRPGTPGGTGTGGETSQLIVVTSPKASNPTATLTAFERGADKSWKPVIGPTKAFLGSLGMGEPKDNVYRSPEGTYPLDQAFGRLANPGTKMPYFQTTKRDWWDSNMQSPTYNTHVRQDKSPGGDSENLYDMGPVYDYAVNIAHNPQRVPGKASAMFLHVSNNQPTMGCIAIDKDLMRKTLVWLDPAKNPKITVGVNKSAPSGDAPAITPQGTTPSPSAPGRGTTPSAPGTTTPGTTTPGTTTPGTAPGTGGGLADLVDQAQLTDLLTALTDLIPEMAGS